MNARAMEQAPVTPPRVAVVILSFNQQEQTLRCMEHLLALQADEGPFNVLLWDNGSADGTAEAAGKMYPSVRVHACAKNLGVAGGRNAAAQRAIEAFHPEFLLFLDNDIVVQPGFVASLRAPFLAPGGERIGQTQAKLRLSREPDLLNNGGGCHIQFWLGLSRPIGYRQPDQGQYDTPVECVSSGGAMMVRATLFDELGGFDERFNPYGPEDLDFSLRLRKREWQSWYIPAAVGFHDFNHTFGAEGYTEEYARHRAKHWLLLMRRHASLLDWIGFAFIGVPVITARILVREVAQGNFGALRGLMRGTLGRR